MLCHLLTGRLGVSQGMPLLYKGLHWALLRAASHTLGHLVRSVRVSLQVLDDQVAVERPLCRYAHDLGLVLISY